MHSTELHINKDSQYFTYTPSLMGRKGFLYVVCVGDFQYEKGYLLQRGAFDSFLLMYLRAGELDVSIEGRCFTARSGDFVLLDCYQRHGYQTTVGCDCLWLHFDGVQARTYYEMVYEKMGNVFGSAGMQSAITALEQLYLTFARGNVIREAWISKEITDILTAFLLYEKETPSPSMADITSYINEHFAEPLTIEALAQRAMLSPYHFIRTFKRQVGFTPHEYLVRTRIHTACYLLKNTGLSVKDICFRCGFTSESTFCNAFRQSIGVTPSQYRGQTP